MMASTLPLSSRTLQSNNFADQDNNGASSWEVSYMSQVKRDSNTQQQPSKHTIRVLSNKPRTDFADQEDQGASGWEASFMKQVQQQRQNKKNKKKESIAAQQHMKRREEEEEPQNPYQYQSDGWANLRDPAEDRQQPFSLNTHQPYYQEEPLYFNPEKNDKYHSYRPLPQSTGRRSNYHQNQQPNQQEPSQYFNEERTDGWYQNPEAPRQADQQYNYNPAFDDHPPQYYSPTPPAAKREEDPSYIVDGSGKTFFRYSKKDHQHMSDLTSFSYPPSTHQQQQSQPQQTAYSEEPRPRSEYNQQPQSQRRTPEEEYYPPRGQQQHQAYSDMAHRPQQRQRGIPENEYNPPPSGYNENRNQCPEWGQGNPSPPPAYSNVQNDPYAYRNQPQAQRGYEEGYHLQDPRRLPPNEPYPYGPPSPEPHPPHRPFVSDRYNRHYDDSMEIHYLPTQEERQYGSGLEVFGSIFTGKKRDPRGTKVEVIPAEHGDVKGEPLQ